MNNLRLEINEFYDELIRQADIARETFAETINKIIDQCKELRNETCDQEDMVIKKSFDFSKSLYDSLKSSLELRELKRKYTTDDDENKFLGEKECDDYKLITTNKNLSKTFKALSRRHKNDDEETQSEHLSHMCLFD